VSRYVATALLPRQTTSASTSRTLPDTALAMPGRPHQVAVSPIGGDVLRFAELVNTFAGSFSTKT
jgi:hypothetical protein